MTYNLEELYTTDSAVLFAMVAAWRESHPPDDMDERTAQAIIVLAARYCANGWGGGLREWMKLIRQAAQHG